jgi:hypothetical protein
VQQRIAEAAEHDAHVITSRQLVNQALEQGFIHQPALPDHRRKHVPHRPAPMGETLSLATQTWKNSWGIGL